VYAYTQSALQTAILRLFSRCECILPNLFVGVLTRDSVTAALACGLSADHIVAYLRQRAHPTVAARSPIVPEVRPCIKGECFMHAEGPSSHAASVHSAAIVGFSSGSRGTTCRSIICFSASAVFNQHSLELRQQASLGIPLHTSRLDMPPCW
jgi:hypothetical protein